MTIYKNPDAALVALVNAHDSLRGAVASAAAAERVVADAQRQVESACAHCDAALTRVQSAVTTDSPAIPAALRANESAMHTAQTLHAAGEDLIALRQATQAALDAVDTETARLRAGGS